MGVDGGPKLASGLEKLGERLGEQLGKPSELTPLQKSSAGNGDKASFLKSPVAWARTLSRHLPWQYLASMVMAHHVLKGIVAGGGDEGLIGKPIEFLLGAQHIPAARLQALISVGATAPWVLKPLIGFLSDTVPILGYRKKYYMVIMTVLAMAAVSSLGLHWAVTPWMIVVCLFFASMQVAGSTLLVEARLSQVAKQQAELGPEIVTVKETCMNSGIIMSAMLVGPLISYAGPRAPYVLALPLVASMLVIPMNNWLQEQRLPVGEDRVDLAAIRTNPFLFGMGVLLLPLLLMLACGSAVQLSQHLLTVLAIVATVIVVGGYLMVIRPEISGPMVFYFIFRCMNLQINGALFYFLTDTPSAFPEGPHFSPFFYVSCITSVAIAGRMIGFMTAKDLFGQWHYRTSMLVTVPLVACTQLLLVPLLLRWNVALGVHDSTWVLAWTFLDMVARGWRQFPFSVLFLQTTPRGLEASSLALNTGAVNFGMTLSFFFGSFALHHCHVWPTGDTAESLAFASLWKVQVAVALLPLAALPLAGLFLPRGTQVDALITENPCSATHGAPVARCCGV
mmetsp:Transcript_96743/g.282833  ORF Transcript_96743/g.282833 Transcript_96743/m.282833 type:complete len:565 (-) Transcript_96743:107-1801(-)